MSQDTKRHTSRQQTWCWIVGQSQEVNRKWWWRMTQVKRGKAEEARIMDHPSLSFCLFQMKCFGFSDTDFILNKENSLHGPASWGQLELGQRPAGLGVGSWFPSYKSLELRSGAARDQGSTNTTQTLSQPHCIQNSVFHLLAVGLHTHCQIHSLSMRKMHSSTIIIL